MDDIVIIIPSYKPNTDIMFEFLNDVERNFNKIVVIDDGSGEEYSNFFESIKNDKVTVLKHYINYGKGRGIKTAFNYVLNTYKDIVGVVTADCDGQHKIEDIKKCAEKLKEDPSKLIIGKRNFDERQVPFKSRYGNKITRAIFNIFVGVKITDTQSGLRAFGKENMIKFIDTAGERYDYETNMLIETKNKGIEIEEIPISTIYIRNNSLSHFDSIKDSARIYKLFVKYIFSSLSSFIVDLLLFAIFIKMLLNIDIGITTKIFLATIMARILSSVYNFGLNSKVVFKNKSKKSIVKYFILAIFQMIMSAMIVSKLFDMLNVNSICIKIIVDTIIFIVNFIVQREWVFK